MFGRSKKPEPDLDQYTNLKKAQFILDDIAACKKVQGGLKAAFVHRELDGGAKAALEHPLYLEAQKAIDALEEELTQLI